MNKLKKSYLEMNKFLIGSREKLVSVFSKYLSGELDEKDVNDEIDKFLNDYDICYQEILKYEKSILYFAVDKKTFDLAGKIVDVAAKEAIVRKRYIKTYLPFDDEKIELLKEKIYNFLDAFGNGVNAKDMLLYIHFNEPLSINYNRPRGAGSLADPEMEIIKNIIKNYRPKSLKK